MMAMVDANSCKSYWSLCVVFCCYGHLQTIFLQYLYLFPQAFEAIASSSGGIQTSIDKEIKLGGKIITMKSESDIHKQKGESEVWTPTSKQTILRRWLLEKMCWILQIISPPPAHRCSSNSPGSSCQDFSFLFTSLVFWTVKVGSAYSSTTPDGGDD